jgi:hypothetical protein
VKKGGHNRKSRRRYHAGREDGQAGQEPAMSSYAALYTEKGEFLIARKAVVNAYWGGKDTFRDTVVHQAGQYALIGGKSWKAKSPREEAIDEFAEETGAPFPSAYTWNSYNIDHADGSSYWLVTFKITCDIAKLCDVINGNLGMVEFKQHHRNAIGPRSPKVKDWELEKVLVVPQGKLDSYLGVRVEVPAKHKDRVSMQDPSTQAIDWYAEMCGVLQGIDCTA